MLRLRYKTIPRAASQGFIKRLLPKSSYFSSSSQPLLYPPTNRVTSSDLALELGVAHYVSIIACTNTSLARR